MPSGKARLVDYMTMYPQSDILGYQNSRNQDKVLDLGFDIPDYGHVYLTAFGMGWLARKMGYISEADHAEKMAESEKTLVHLSERVKELEEQISQLPLGVERIMNGLRDLSVSAVADLGSIARAQRGNDGEANPAGDSAASSSTGGDNKAPGKSRRTDV